MTEQRPDPFTEIREALQRCWDCGQTGGAVREAADSGLAALARLEREAAEREAAMQATLKDAREELRDERRLRHVEEARADVAEARVREVEAERDDAHKKIGEDRETRWSMQRRLDVAAERLAEYEATVARQAEALQTLLPYAEVQIRGQGDTYNEDWDEHPALVVARAVLASPEAAAAEPTTPSPMRPFPGAAALPAVDAAREDPLTGANCGLCGATADNFHVSDGLWYVVGLNSQVCFKCFRIAAWHKGIRPDPAWEVSLPAVDAPPEPTT